MFTAFAYTIITVWALCAAHDVIRAYFGAPKD